MEEQLISFETAKLAKEKGFYQEPNKLKIPYYNYKGEFNGDVSDYLKKYLKGEDTSDVESVSAPTQSLLSKWLREKYDIDVIINTYRNQNQKYYKYFISEKSKNLIKSEEYYDTYEEAYEIGLQEALKLIK